MQDPGDDSEPVLSESLPDQTRSQPILLWGQWSPGLKSTQAPWGKGPCASAMGAFPRYSARGSF